MSGYSKEQLQAVARIIQAQPDEDRRANFIRLEIAAGHHFLSSLHLADVLFDDVRELVTVFYDYETKCAILPYASISTIVISRIGGDGRLERPQ